MSVPVGIQGAKAASFSAPGSHFLRYIGYFALLLLSVGPTLTVDIPAMVDYPNHLARMYILSQGSTTAANKFYYVAWGVYPNLAMDLIIPWMSRIINVETATRMFFLGSQLLVISGGLMLERIVKGKLSIAPFTVALFLYNLPFAWGFVNFEFGLGVALWAIVSWLAFQKQSQFVRALAHCAFAALLFAAHFFALGIYGATIGLHELWRLRTKQTTATELVITFAVLAVPVAALLFAMFYFGGALGGTRTEWGLILKPYWLLYSMNGYNIWLSIAGMSFVWGTFLFLTLRGRLRFIGSGRWIAIGFTLLFFAMPFRLFDTAFTDVRMISAAAFIWPAFIQLSLPDQRWQKYLAMAASTFILANLALVWVTWASYRPEYAALIESFGRIAKGSTVLVAHSGDAPDPPLQNLPEYPIYHAPALAVAYADAFVPTLFTYPGKQPVTVTPAYRHLDIMQGGPVPIALLKAIAAGAQGKVPGFIQNWPRDFGYLYVLGPRISNPLPQILDEVAAGRRFVLYRVKRAPASPVDPAGNAPQ